MFGVKNPGTDTLAKNYELVIADANNAKIEGKVISAGLDSTKTWVAT